MEICSIKPKTTGIITIKTKNIIHMFRLAMVHQYRLPYFKLTLSKRKWKEKEDENHVNCWIKIAIKKFNLNINPYKVFFRLKCVATSQSLDNWSFIITGNLSCKEPWRKKCAADIIKYLKDRLFPKNLTFFVMTDGTMVPYTKARLYFSH